jgi:hypothetical protein
VEVDELVRADRRVIAKRVLGRSTSASSVGSGASSQGPARPPGRGGAEGVARIRRAPRRLSSRSTSVAAPCLEAITRVPPTEPSGGIEPVCDRGVARSTPRGPPAPRRIRRAVLPPNAATSASGQRVCPRTLPRALRSRNSALRRCHKRFGAEILPCDAATSVSGQKFCPATLPRAFRGRNSALRRCHERFGAEILPDCHLSSVLGQTICPGRAQPSPKRPPEGRIRAQPSPN